jgi:predicted DNA-binding protein with PD1-like motif
LNHKLIHSGVEKTYVLVFETGDEFTEGLMAFAKAQNLTAAHFTAIGAFRHAKVGWFHPDEQRYLEIEINEQVEVLSLVGNVSDFEGQPKVHAHVVLGKQDASTCGGHILQAYVRPTLEVTITESPSHLHRKHDPTTGLALIRL